MTSRKTLLASLLIALAACSPPKRDYSVEQIGQTEDLEELMDVQATVADPLMRRARGLEPLKVTDELFAQYADMGTRLQATAKRLPSFNTEEGWKKLSTQMEQQAAELKRLADAKDGAGTIKTALAIKETCAACHDEYR